MAMGDQSSHNLPAGFHFRPTKEEIIRAYLFPKVMGLPLPLTGMVADKEIYGQNAEPWKVFGDIDDDNCSSYRDIKEAEGGRTFKTVYVFTKLTKTSPNSNMRKYSRVAGGGTWVGQSRKRIIMHSTTGEVIGETKILSFKRSERKTTSTADDGASWIMHEYSLSGAALVAIGERENDLVLCKITKKAARRRLVTADR